MPKKAAKKSKALSIAAPGANGDLPLHGGLDELINLFDYRLSISEAELDAARAENEPKHIAACRQDRSSILTSLSCLRQAAAVGSAELPPQVVQWEARLARAEAELDAARIEGDQRTMAACRQDLSSILVSLSYLIQQQYPSAIFGGPQSPLSLPPIGSPAHSISSGSSFVSASATSGKHDSSPASVQSGSELSSTSKSFFTDDVSSVKLPPIRGSSDTTNATKTIAGSKSALQKSKSVEANLGSKEVSRLDDLMGSAGKKVVRGQRRWQP